ncbi:MAG: hypothetical protein A3G30_03195 [Chlamydiae bacterium RIFCSPLOWO2_12_FULL_49_12]|nr:MAG: hypothetical protein A3D18_05710 [Chlamydiae bacterium RIFCSPHIGHO2_02_FULL_49_29]OGN62643.1 MAG: hypothetical protein A3E26_04230 [Chlamydiae bacterium RIFCSPHIGHO2_12_FULL_49_32]OGN70869.1 MAG: hypothetical protein A3I15_06555 [Chlamydiae bacterium RIFCSPLOWO2_02_FULL_49_12]OGN71332.1 MAG: hypothetical protein A3G30_03195 [Chlamydiae bacterium RIFCSPLOWO2_12_FULL_49_12]
MSTEILANLADRMAASQGNREYFPSVFKSYRDHRKFVEVCQKNVSSKLDLAARVIVLSVDGLITNPLLALASLVEAAVHSFYGGMLFLASLMPYPGNLNVRLLAKGHGKNVLMNILIMGASVYYLGEQPFRAVSLAVHSKGF